MRQFKLCQHIFMDLYATTAGLESAASVQRRCAQEIRSACWEHEGSELAFEAAERLTLKKALDLKSQAARVASTVASQPRPYTPTAFAEWRQLRRGLPPGVLAPRAKTATHSHAGARKRRRTYVEAM